MASTYFNPATGEYYEFKPGEVPPTDWKELPPLALHPDWDIISHGGCTLYDPGKEPKLFVDPETGASQWVKWPYVAIPGNWKVLIPLNSPPPLTTNKTKYFNTATGESYTFGPGQKPPKNWKRLKPVPPHPDWDIVSRGGCVLYEPGKEPLLFVDPETGNLLWVKWPYITVPGNWKPLTPLPAPPPLTDNEKEYLNPATGESYIFRPGQAPPPDWIKSKPAPPHPDWDIVSRGGCVLYDPGKEPKLFVNPETGESQWVKWPYIAVPAGWVPLQSLPVEPPLTDNEREYFNPATGESYDFGTGQTPPQNWRKLKPVPPHPDDDIISRGGCVLYDPGKEPKLFVNPETGESQWIKWPYITVPENWKTLMPLVSEPPMTENKNEFFDPQTGQSYVFRPGQTPPAGWAPLKPVPPHPDWDIISRGGCVLYEPGKEPMLFVDPETGSSQWVKWPYIVVPENWKPLSALPASPDRINRSLNTSGDEPLLDDVDSNEESALDDAIRFLSRISVAANPVLEWSIWNPIINTFRISAWNPAIDISPLNYYYNYSYRQTRLQNLRKLVAIRNSLASLQGRVRSIYGFAFESLAGGNLLKSYPALDVLDGGKALQVKAIFNTNEKNIADVARRAANKLLKLYRSGINVKQVNKYFFSNRVFSNILRMNYVVPSGSPASVYNTILSESYKRFALNPAFRKLGLFTEGVVNTGIPGKIGTVLKGLSVAGGLLSAYQLKQDIEKGDVASGVGSAAGTATLLLEGGAAALGSTTMAAGAALTGSFAAGYAVGTLINEYALPEETKSLIGETLNEFSNMSWRDVWDYYVK